MAYDKIIPVKSRLDHRINYALNKDKTGLSRVLGYIENEDKTTLPGGEVVFESALSCSLDAAFAEMMRTKERWHKPGGVLGYHLIHSYAPGEVTPEEAHAAGVEFARRLLGDRYEAVIATHLDHEHLHCHIVFNSVSFVDGKKYRNNFKDYFGDIRGTSNAVSRERQLSVIDPKSKGKAYGEWRAERQGKPTIRGMVRRDIDAALAEAFTLKSFWAALEKMGYQVKRGVHVKHTAVKPPGGQRFIRLDGLGEGYTEAALLERLGQSRMEPRKAEAPTVHLPRRRYYLDKPLKQVKHLHGFRALYFRYLYLLGGPRPRRKPVPFAVRKEVTRLNRYIEQFHFLREHEIDTDWQLSDLAASLQSQIKGLVRERKALYRQARQGDSVEREIAEINERLRPLRRELRLCARIKEDIPHIREQLEQSRENPEISEKSKSKRKERDHGYKR